ncbi:MAG: twin-arginine translocase subunit TatC [Armatimonadota bacterium]|nr:twin-arginine translocase subunit TatC [Armatimonadota bacterium]
MTDYNPYEFLSESAATEEPSENGANGSHSAADASGLESMTVARQGPPWEKAAVVEEPDAPAVEPTPEAMPETTTLETTAYDHEIPPAYEYEPAEVEATPLEASADGSGPPGDGLPPASPDYGPAPDPYSDPNAPVHDREMDLFDHLRELRARLLHSIAAVSLAMVVTWNYTNEIQDWFLRPVLRVLKEHDIAAKIIMMDPTEAFTTYFQISLVSALLLAMPYMLYQMWLFLEPALTHSERRYTTVLLPFSIILFVAGAALGYAVSPLFFQFFLYFVPPSVSTTWSYQSTVILLAKTLLVFGVCFQVPVVTIFLNKVGLVSRSVLIEYWRHVVVVIFTVVAIITPTWDPITLTACALPPCILYGLSIWLVKWL